MKHARERKPERASRPALPRAISLPSGLRVRFVASAVERARARAQVAARRARLAPGADPSDATDFAEALAALTTPGLLARVPDGASEGASGDAAVAIDPRGLALRDANVLRAMLARAGVVRERAHEIACENCGANVVARPCRDFEVGPYVDGELDDPELDAPFDFSSAHPIPPVAVGARRARLARSVTLAPRTLGEAAPLWRVADRGVPTITPAVAAAAGIVAIGAERRASRVALALRAASPEAWTEIVLHFEDAHYGERLAARARCGACKATNRFVVPFAREFDLEIGDRVAPFPDEATFEARVRRIGRRVYAAKRVRNIELVVETGVPHCDDGGEPLLGSYTPPGVSMLDVPEPPCVRIYYRTFRDEMRGASDAEIEAEIRETIEHEIDHHLHFLSGYDPMDAEERADIVREEARRVGRRESSRRRAMGALESARGFARATWPLWLLVSAFTAWKACSA